MELYVRRGPFAHRITLQKPATHEEFAAAVVGSGIFCSEIEFCAFVHGQGRIERMAAPERGYSPDMEVFLAPDCLDVIDVAVFLPDGTRVLVEAKNPTPIAQIVAAAAPELDQQRIVAVMHRSVPPPEDNIFDHIWTECPSVFLVEHSPRAAPADAVPFDLGAAQPRAADIAVCVEISHDFMVKADVPPHTRIADITHILSSLCGLPALLLFSNGRRLKDATRVKELLSDTSYMVILVAVISGDLPLRLHHEGAVRTLTVRSTDLVGAVRSRVLAQFNIPVAAAEPLFFRGAELADTVALWSLCDPEPAITVGRASYDADYAQRVEQHFAPLIELNDPCSCFTLGLMLVLGRAVPRDVSRGAELLECSARTHIGANVALADLIERGVVPGTPEAARQHLRYAANLDVRAAQHRLGASLAHTSERGAAIKFLRESADGGYVLAQTYLGKLNESPQDVTQYLTLATERRHATAFKIYAVRSATVDPVASERFMKTAAELGSGGASLFFALRLLREKRTREGIRYLRQAVKYGSVRAQRCLGLILKRGSCGLTRDADQAFSLLTRAAAKGDAKAQYHLAKMLLDGEPQLNEARAYELLRAACERYSPAKMLLINLMLRGIGCARDSAAAFELARCEAEKGSCEAKRILAELYERGIGCARNAAAAEQLYFEAQDGDRVAVFRYAMVLKRKGAHTPQQRQTLESLLQRAVSFGIYEAHEELGLLYLGDNERLSQEHFAIASSHGLMLSRFHVGRYLLEHNRVDEGVVLISEAAEAQVKPAVFAMYLVHKDNRYNRFDDRRSQHFLMRGVALDIPEAQMEYGVALLREDKPREALQMMQRAIGNGATTGIAECVDAMERLNMPYQEILDMNHFGADHGDVACMMNCGRCLEQDGAFDEAANFYRMAIRSGEKAAFHPLGRLFERGCGLPRDLEKALQLYREGAELGSPECRLGAGRILESAEYPHRSVREALQFYRSVAEEGSGEGMFHLARILLTGGGELEPQPERAYRFFLQAFESGVPESALELARMSDEGVGCRRDGRIAIEYYTVAVENEVKEACGPLARKLFFGVDCNYPNPNQARDILQTGCELGDAESFFLLGELFAADGNIETATEYYLSAAKQDHTAAMTAAAVILAQNDQTVTQAAELFRRAADRHDPLAACNIGIMLAKGKGVTRDYKESLKYLNMAVEEGSFEAMYNAAVLMLKFNSNNQYDNYIRTYFRAAADSGNAQAMYNIGVLLVEKEPKEPEEGMRYIKMAADAGIVAAMYKFAYYILAASSSQKEEEVAAYYCCKGAECGSLDCFCLYGVMLLNGKGVEMNVEDALDIFTKGTEREHPHSTYCLAMYMLENGGDRQRAIELLEKAVALGCEYAGPQLENLAD